MKHLILIPSAFVLCAALWLRPASATLSPVERGEYLVNTIGCADCHTPLRMGPAGPERDPDRAFAGHPQELVMPPAPALGDGPWNVAASGTVTAWSGPWGTSFTANLTPDVETGIGSWSEETFIATIRNRRHLGVGREILPPMPAEFYGRLTDEDLASIYAYLRTVPAVSNRVPDPIPPASAQ